MTLLKYDRSNFPKLVDLSAIAEREGVSTSAVSNWARTYDDFPEPLEVLAIGVVYVWDEVSSWLDLHDNLGQPTREKLSQEQKAEIRARIAGGDTRVSVIAREYEVSRALIYKFAGDLLTDPDGA